MQATNVAGQPHKNYLRPKQQIGSCKLPINFKGSQSVFHHDDIPPEKRERKNEVKQWARSKVLSVEQEGWNKSTEHKHPICERRKMENFVHDRSNPYQYNYRAEVLPDKLIPKIDESTKFHITQQSPSMVERLKMAKSQDTTGILHGKFKTVQEMPVHPKLADAPQWNLSTAPVPKQTQERAQRFTEKAWTSTHKKNKVLYGDPAYYDGAPEIPPTPPKQAAEDGEEEAEEDGDLDDEMRLKPKPKEKRKPTASKRYVTPVQSYNKVLEAVRANKEAGTFNTKYTVFQKVAEPVDRSKLTNRLAIEPSRKFKVTEHSGKWEFNAAEGRHMWSDTGSFVYESRGDVVCVKNPDSYNYASPNVGQPSWMAKAQAAAAQKKQPPTVNRAPPGMNYLESAEYQELLAASRSSPTNAQTAATGAAGGAGPIARSGSKSGREEVKVALTAASSVDSFDMSL